jgi:exosortase
MVKFLFIIKVIVFAVTFFPSLIYTNSVWVDDGTYSHGYINLALCILMLYKVRSVTFKLTTPLCITIYDVFYVLSLTIGIIANHYDVELIHRGFMLVALYLLIQSSLPKESVKAFRAPLVILSLALPLWGLTIPLLQLITVWVVGNIVSLTGLEVMFRDIYITIPLGTFKVANGCSGLRYILVALTLALFFSFKFLEDKRDWAKLCLCAIIFALLTNWVRIIYLVYVGHISAMQDPMLKDHNLLGWFVFFVPVYVIFKYGYRLEYAKNI